jgi:hypothetical protein
MDKESLAQLIAISRAAGANLDYVQAGGGNTSVKSHDGRTMAIKASGTPLTAMSETAGWVELDTIRVPARHVCSSTCPPPSLAAPGDPPSSRRCTPCSAEWSSTLIPWPPTH